MKLFISFFLFLSLSSVLSHGQIIGNPPNVTSIAAAFNFSELDDAVSGSANSTTVVLNVTHTAGPSNIIYSNIGTFSFTEIDNAVISPSTGAANITSGRFTFSNIGGTAGNTLTGTYTGSVNPAVGINVGIITAGTGKYVGASGPVLFNNSETSQPTTVSQTRYTSTGVTHFQASIIMA